MSSAINSLTSGLIQSVLGNDRQNEALAANSLSSAALSQPQDIGQLSPLAKLLSSLQQLQQSDPAKYQQVTQQIATNLQDAAQTAQSEGNTGAANQLNQLAGDFGNAAKTGQLPNIQDLAKAVGGPHHHHGHAHAHANPAGGTDSAGSSTVSSPSLLVTQLLAAAQVNTTPNAALDPLNIIQSALSSAGVSQ